MRRRLRRPPGRRRAFAPARPPASVARTTATAGALTAVLAAVYLIIAPPAADLASAQYRSDVFARHGFTLWDNGWYGGHHLPGYSLLAPALGSLLGVRVLLALSALAAAAAFAVIMAECLPEGRALLGACWFALGISVALLSGRVAYTLGLALGLAALAAQLRGRTAPALLLAIACAAASPVAAAFLALAALTGALTAPPDGHRHRRGRWLALLAAAAAPIALLALAFPEGGYEPFAPSAFWPALGGVLVVALALLVTAQRPTLALGCVLYALALAAAFALHTPVGGNAARLGSLLAGPLLGAALARRRRRRLLLAAAALPLLYWQVVTPIRDLTIVSGEASAGAAYYRPLISELERLTAGRPTRIEVPLTTTHGEATHLAGRFLLARGWERQLDTRYDALFYGAAPAAGTYRAWLYDNAVAYVARPDAKLDHAATAEARLIDRGLPYLRPVWSSAHWRLYAVAGAQPLISPPATISTVTADAFAVTAPRPGAYTARIRFSSYWRPTQPGVCVARGPRGWTELDVKHPGATTVGMAFSLGRVLSRGRRCQ